MKGGAVGGCGCVGALILLVLSVPLLFLGVGAGASSGTAAAVGAASTGSGAQIVPAGGTSCNVAVRCQQLPAELGYVPVGFFPDEYTNPPGECTSWAAALWPGHRGRGVTWSGDAWEWYGNAAAQGYAVSTAPAVGAIAVFQRTSGDAGEWGHVAVVLGFDASSIRLTEMNYAGRFVVDERTVALADPQLAGFIPVPADALTP